MTNNKQSSKWSELRAYLSYERQQNLFVPLLAIILSLIVGSLIILGQGKNPLQVYMNLLQGSGILPKSTYAAYKNIFSDFSSFLNAWTPMLFASLAFAVAMKAGLFNIGVAGQMLTSAFVATIVIGYSSLPAVIAKPAVVIIGIITGMLLGALIGYFKYRFNINEVVSTIMVNYIAQFVISFFINTYYVNPVSRQSILINNQARLTLMQMKIAGIKVDIPLGIILALVAAVALRFILKRTVFGYELAAVGLSRPAAAYAGIHVGSTIVSAMALSGALAGLAGVTYYLGYFASIQPRTLVSTGFDCIAVSLLAESNPLAIIAFSFLITILSKGSTYMNSASGLESEISAVITGIILLFSAGSVYIHYCLDKWRKNRKDKCKVNNNGTNHN